EESGEPAEEFADDFDEFVQYMVDEGILEWREEPSFVEPLYKRDRPYSIIIALTSACNLRCPFCAVHAGDTRKDDMVFDDIVPLVEQIKKLKPTPVTISGGEPLIKKKMLLYILEELSSMREIDLSVFTNGTLITKDYAQQLYDAGLRVARVSIDGHTAELHDHIRGTKGIFDKTVRGIENLKDVGIYVNTVSVISSMNYQYLKEIREFVRQIADSFNINSVAPSGRAFGTDLLLSPDNTFSVGMSNFDSGGIRTLITPRDRCVMGEHVYIASNGDIFPCAQMQFPDVKMGNIKENDLSEIYKIELVQNILKLTVKDFGQCKECDIRYFCGGGCRGFAYRYTSSFQGTDPFNCEIYKRMACSILENGEETTKRILQELLESTKELG
ncbi:MAG: radical SAM protein, partial [Theionarchaea archaeon]|nr:radical SAM protein [Theionarchaea archaeon]